jgi:hypothetical protein
VREGLGHRDRTKRRAGAWGPWELRPYERNRCAEHGVTVNTALGMECARPTGGSHGRTTDAPEQRFNGVNLRAPLEVG